MIWIVGEHPVRLIKAKPAAQSLFFSVRRGLSHNRLTLWDLAPSIERKCALAGDEHARPLELAPHEATATRILPAHHRNAGVAPELRRPVRVEEGLDRAGRDVLVATELRDEVANGEVDRVRRRARGVRGG
eukprot:CAMPEP_0198507984 /NCGR_PEP_ID=MMETSP1462-20131121/12665_1 /TAXON_ID=1333877 /ORGANISM="Brandtodinium nutriculum, Strain RCC3387" /LENGTH=130 /DNA_ID=CAMNT_0044237247 /DNA_START=463 /DNA_END=852 /DNA_ORIENTATION=+